MALAQLAFLLMAALLSQATGATITNDAPTNAQSSGGDGVTTGATAAQSTSGTDSNTAANIQILREMEALRKQNAALAEDMEAMRKQNKSLEGSVADLQVQQNGIGLSQERAKEVRHVVEDVLKDADSRASLTPAVPTAGFGDRGFFIASPDGNFRLNLSGQLQIRYAANFLSSRDYSILNANPGAGVNWFIAGRQIKLTTDIGFTTAPLWFNNGIYGAGVAGTNYRVEPSGGGGQIVVRSQLQLLF
ncbi:MAG: hypothetical protein EXS12_04870 [Phycisphaerales bacterium]|nr:hypothetical protein [Phycisphaerales bacterium]